MSALADTNVLVYRFDPRFPEKQRLATEVLRDGVATGEVLLAHQALVEFVAAVTRPQGRDRRPLLELPDAIRETEELLAQFDIIHPDADTVRLALRGVAAYQLSWFDAHMWAHAEQHGIAEILSEDFQHDRTYGTVRVANPFI